MRRVAKGTTEIRARDSLRCDERHMEIIRPPFEHRTKGTPPEFSRRGHELCAPAIIKEKLNRPQSACPVCMEISEQMRQPRYPSTLSNYYTAGDSYRAPYFSFSTVEEQNNEMEKNLGGAESVTYD